MTKLLAERQALEHRVYDAAHKQYAEEGKDIFTEIDRLRDIIYAGTWLDDAAKTFLREPA